MIDISIVCTHEWVCANHLRIIVRNTHTKSYTLFHCSGLQRDICPMILLFFHLVSILRAKLQVHIKATTICLFLSRFVPHTLLLSLCVQTVHKLKHICVWVCYGRDSTHALITVHLSEKIRVIFDTDVLNSNVLNHTSFWTEFYLKAVQWFALLPLNKQVLGLTCPGCSTATKSRSYPNPNVLLSYIVSWGLNSRTSSSYSHLWLMHVHS